MRLLSLSIPHFKNLQEFEIDFDDEAPIAVLVGRNGTGKSNVIEALTIIFRDLDLGWTTEFSYRLRYSCRAHLVELAHDAKTGDRGCQIDGVRVSFSRVEGESGRSYRPDNVFGYYSGPSDRLAQHYDYHQQRFYRDLIRGIERPLRPLFYARAVHSNFALLAFFLEQDSEVRRFLEEQLGILDLDSVLFVMKRPSWKSTLGDPRFWYARGTVQRFLDQLHRLALAPLRVERRQRLERFYLYLPDLSALGKLAGLYDSTQEFFKALESTWISELIEDVRIRVVIARAESPLTFRELSEGEQQLLLVLGLIRFTREQESLFLLDEPDTHLNPAWSVQYRQLLRDLGALDESSHVVLATHDPLVVAGLRRQEVRILERGSDRQVSASRPLEDPQGMGVGALLTSEVYGLRSQLDLETLQKLDRKRRLTAKASLDDKEESDLLRLNEELDRLRLFAEDRDPEFQRFLAAKYEVEAEGVEGVALSREEIEEERQLAREIVARLNDEAESGSSDEPGQ